MQPSEIERRIVALPGIERLNDMQRLMLTTHATSLALIAPTGSGKTIAFAIAILRHLKPAGRFDGTQAVIIAPSRELVTQTTAVMRELARGWKVTACYGGHSMREETQSLIADCPAIIVATPGRLLDHMQRGNLDRCRPTVMVLDEYDKSLELGFADEMRRISRRLGAVSSVVLTSATPLAEMPDYLSHLQPETIDLRPGSDRPRSRMDIVEVDSPSRDKLQTLIDLLRCLPRGKAIVFVNHRESAERVCNALRDQGLPAGLYHGALDQQQRATAVDLLANGTTPILVATDLAARGLDIDGLSHIVHYHLPVDKETWTHRNGRTARQQASGTVYVIASEADSVPEFITYDRPYSPTGDVIDKTPEVATLYFNAGRREKISRGDIAGFLAAKTPVGPDEIGCIALHDHYALAAVPAAKAAAAVKAAATERLKGRRVRVQLLRDFPGCR